MDIREAIENLLKSADEVTAEHWKKCNFTQPCPTHVVQYISEKWARIVTSEPGRNESVYGFVCLYDGFTKALGTLKTGDIHKAATYKAPAKHARGNVFDENLKNCLTPYGIVYLK